MKKNRFVAPLCITASLTLFACASTNLDGKKSTNFISIQDGRAELSDGAVVLGNGTNTFAVITLQDGKLSVQNEFPMPTSLVGPPTSIAILPNRKYALVTAATKLDPADPKKVISADVVSLVLISDSVGPSKVVTTAKAGAGASGVAINREGTLALIANRVEGTVSVFEINGEQLKENTTIMIAETSGPSHVVIAPNGKKAFLTRDGDHQVSVLDINGLNVTLSKRNIYAGLKPYCIDIDPSGSYAVVGNLGFGQGDSDSISLIDLTVEPPRVIDTVSVGQTPEGVAFSSSGNLVGVTVINGSNKPKASSFYGQASYKLFSIKNGKLFFMSEVIGGNWLQGQAFTADDRNVVIQDAMNKEMRLYKIDGNQVTDTGERLKMKAAPATIRYWK